MRIKNWTECRSNKGTYNVMVLCCSEGVIFIIGGKAISAAINDSLSDMEYNIAKSERKASAD